MRYNHNCTDCVELGMCENFDLYVCQDINDELGISLIARYGDSEKDFLCCNTNDVIKDAILKVALERAIEMGHLVSRYTFVKSK